MRTHLIRQQRGSPNTQSNQQVRASQRAFRREQPRRSGRGGSSNPVVNRSSSSVQIRVEREPSNNFLINESNTPPPVSLLQYTFFFIGMF